MIIIQFFSYYPKKDLQKLYIKESFIMAYCFSSSQSKMVSCPVSMANGIAVCAMGGSHDKPGSLGWLIHLSLYAARKTTV